jgi:hypothetical protein
MYTRSSDLANFLTNCQSPSGGWSFSGSQQASTEATCLACIAIAGESRGSTRLATRFLLHSQLIGGGWPAFEGDPDPSWTTALALCTLTAGNDLSDARERALKWLLSERGKEGHWFWRWKFKTVDRAVRFDPDKYGWPWSRGAGSWVIPTASSIIGIKQFTVCNRSQASEKRIRLGVEMLLDRAWAAVGILGTVLFMAFRYVRISRRPPLRCSPCRTNLTATSFRQVRIGWKRRPMRRRQCRACPGAF